MGIPCHVVYILIVQQLKNSKIEFDVRITLRKGVCEGAYQPPTDYFGGNASWGSFLKSKRDIYPKAH